MFIWVFFVAAVTLIQLLCSTDLQSVCFCTLVTKQ